MRQTTLAAALGAGVLALGGSTLFLNSNATATTPSPTILEPIVVSATAPIAVTLRIATEGNSARYLVQEQLDGFVKARILETDRYPDVVFVPTSIQGIALPLPTSGTHSFTLAGNLTIRGITRPVTWKVNATFTEDTVNGTGSTSFAFDDFGLTQPRVPVVLSVADTIQFEYQFTFTR